MYEIKQTENHKYLVVNCEGDPIQEFYSEKNAKALVEELEGRAELIANNNV